MRKRNRRRREEKLLNEIEKNILISIDLTVGASESKRKGGNVEREIN